jgi:hypothetical protein
VKNLDLLLPDPLTVEDRDTAGWATVTAISPLRIKLDGESTALPFTPDSIAGGLAVNDRVWVAFAMNHDVPFYGRRVIVIGKAGGSLLPHTHTATVLGENGIAGVATTSGTNQTTSTTYVSMAGTGSVTSFSLVKALTSTRTRVEIGATFYTSVATSGARFGVLINGVDYDVCQLRADIPANQRLQVSGAIYIGASVIAAGTWTVQGRWLRTEGAGTLTRDTGDWLAISAREVI